MLETQLPLPLSQEEDAPRQVIEETIPEPGILSSLSEYLEWKKNRPGAHSPTRSLEALQEYITKRDIVSETKMEQVSPTSSAVSSHKALYYHLIAPETIRLLALRKTVGAQKYGWVQWRQGINDIEYVADRYNHLWEHLLKFQEGDETDDNLAAMLWALDCLVEVRRLCPEVLKKVVGTSNLYAESATQYHQEQRAREGKS
jgi:hypothetical protein